MLHDFVVGEQSMRDFPCAFNEVHKLGHKEGIAENAKNKNKNKIASCKRLSKLHLVLSIK